VFRLWVAVCAVASLALVASGCNVNNNADLQKGRMTFQQKCGICHTLAEAGTAAQIGPNLDAAFAGARASGEGENAIKGVVSAQIENPRPGYPGQTNTYMPKNVVTGQNLKNVAAYVASVAGIPGIKPPHFPPPQLFAQQCGICHTLAAAGSSGTTGPNLDQVLKGKTASYVKQVIINPDLANVPGFQHGVMPSTFGQSLTPTDIEGLAAFIIMSVSGKK
jgi:mono/diheme cytochrome c family protein